jgi:hypothetical protein
MSKLTSLYWDLAIALVEALPHRLAVAVGTVLVELPAFITRL